MSDSSGLRGQQSNQLQIPTTANFKNVVILPLITRFFTSNTFTSNARLKLAKNQENAKQHPEAEL